MDVLEDYDDLFFDENTKVIINWTHNDEQLSSDDDEFGFGAILREMNETDKKQQQIREEKLILNSPKNPPPKTVFAFDANPIKQQQICEKKFILDGPKNPPSRTVLAFDANLSKKQQTCEKKLILDGPNNATVFAFGANQFKQQQICHQKLVLDIPKNPPRRTVFGQMDNFEKQRETRPKIDRKLVSSGPSSRTVYVGNVEYGATTDELKKHFQLCGYINRVNIILDKHTGRSRGYAYIEFGDENSVGKALELHESTFRCRRIKVNRHRNGSPDTNQDLSRNKVPRKRYKDDENEYFNSKRSRSSHDDDREMRRINDVNTVPHRNQKYRWRRSSGSFRKY